MPGFPLYAYRLTPIDDLRSRAGDTTDFIDIIGIMTEVSDAYMVHLPNKARPTLTRHIMLRDQKSLYLYIYSEIKVCLWGERASAFVVGQDLTETEGKPVVVLFVGGLMKRYQDNYYLSANAAARWYFNPQIPQARHLYSGLQDQRFDVKRVPAPQQAANQRCQPAQLDAKTLVELNGMDPYDYKDDGYRCTVTIARLVPKATWWFASYSRCSKSCSQDGTGYKCATCSSTSFRFKYKISFIALDGTEEAEMICFGDTARQIVGKPVQQLLRMAATASQVPAEIARIVSRRFTFAVSLTQQSYYRENRTYQVNSVIAAHGQHEPAPPAPQPAAPDSPATPIRSRAVDATFSGTTAAKSTPEAENSPDMAVRTPPLALHDDDTPLLKLQENCGKGDRSTARKRLTYDDCTDNTAYDSSDVEAAGSLLSDPKLAKPDVLPADDLPLNAMSGEKKRPRSARVAGQRAG